MANVNGRGRPPRSASEVQAQLSATHDFIASVKGHVGEDVSSAELALKLIHGGSMPPGATNTSLARDWSNYAKPDEEKQSAVKATGGNSSAPPKVESSEKPKMMSWNRLVQAAEHAGRTYGWHDERVLAMIDQAGKFKSDEMMLAMNRALQQYHGDQERNLAKKWRAITDELLQRHGWTRKRFRDEWRMVLGDLAKQGAQERGIAANFAADLAAEDAIRRASR